MPRRSLRLAAPALVLGLVACTSSLEPGEGGLLAGVGGGGDACGTAAWDGYVGQRVDALNDADLPESARVLFPGAVATTDFREDRLNFEITGDTISRVYCG